MNKIKKPLALLLALMMLMTAMPLMAVPASAADISGNVGLVDGRMIVSLNGIIKNDGKMELTAYYGPVEPEMAFYGLDSTGALDLEHTVDEAGYNYIAYFELLNKVPGVYYFHFTGTGTNTFAQKVQFKIKFRYDGTNCYTIGLYYQLSYSDGVLTVTYPTESGVALFSSAKVDGVDVTANSVVSGNTISIPFNKASGGPVPVTLSFSSDRVESYEIYLNKDGTATDGYTTDSEAEEEPGVDLSKLSTGAKIQLGTYASGENEGQPIEWVVAGDGTNGMTAPEGCLPLISSDLLVEGVSFSDEGTNTYSGSGVAKALLQSIKLAEGEGSFFVSRAIPGDQPYGSDCAGVAGNGVTAVLWAPTTKDATALKNAGLSAVNFTYWTCSPGEDDEYAAYVDWKGDVFENGNPVYYQYDVRGAFYLDLSKITSLTLVDGTTDTYILNAPEEETHTHTFSEEWSTDETAHWHECTAEGCDIEDYSECVLEAVAYGEHTFSNGACSVCSMKDPATEISHNISQNLPANVYTNLPTSAKYLSEVSFMVFATGYKNVTVKVDGTTVSASAGVYKFTMPSHDVTVEVNAEPITYNIYQDLTGNVSTTVSTSAKYLSEVSFTVNAPGCGEVAVYVESSLITPSAGVYKFTMPAHDVVVTVIGVHAHSFESGWTTDGTAHWHECTAEGCDINDYSTCGIEGAAYGKHVGMEDFTCDVCNYHDDAGELAAAKADAKKDLEAAKDNANSDEAKAALADAINIIDKATSVDDVASAKTTALLTVEKADKELADAKADAKKDLETAKNNAVSDEAKAAIDKAIANVEKATNPADAASAKSAGITAADNADKTLADTISSFKNTLETAKNDAKSDAAKAAYTDAIAALDNAKSLEDVETIVESAEMNAANADKALADAISTAKSDLEAAKENAVSDAAKAALDEAIANVDKATSPADAASAKSTGTTAAAEADKALADAQAEAIEALETAKAEAASDEAKAAIDEAIEAVEKATNPDAVATEKAEAETAAAEADKALADAKDEAIEALETAKTEAVSDEAKAALDEAIADVEKATNPADTAAAKTSGLENAADADEALAEAIENAKADLAEAEENAVADDAKAALSAAAEDMDNATSLAAVADKKADAEEAAETAEKELADAKAAAIEAVEALAGDDATDEVKQLVEDAKEAINAATGPEAVDTAEDNGLATVEHKQKEEGFTVPDLDIQLGYRETAPVNAESTTNKIIYTSSNEKVVTVDEDGNLKAVGKGKATITATLDCTDISKEIEIEVSYTFWEGLVWHIRNLLELIASGFKWLLGLIGINL